MGDEPVKYTMVTGGCLCGEVRYNAYADLDEAYYCHCRFCQKSSGAPVEVGVSVKPGCLEFTTGAPKYYASSPIGQRGFCESCGSRLVWRSARNPDWVKLSVGSLDHPEGARPQQHLCVESQMPWFNLADDLPRCRSDDLPGLQEEWARVGLTHDGRALQADE